MDSIVSYSVEDNTSECDDKINSLINKYKKQKDEGGLTESCFYNIKEHSCKEETQNKFNCNLCNNSGENYIILECNHIFHIICLTNTQSDKMYDYKKIDDIFLKSIKCPTCNKLINQEELMYLHNKYIKLTSIILDNNNKMLNTLEQQLKMIQEEMRSLYDYRHKLECNKEKSKNIIKTLIKLIE